jgi:hypothetical protein
VAHPHGGSAAPQETPAATGTTPAAAAETASPAMNAAATQGLDRLTAAVNKGFGNQLQPQPSEKGEGVSDYWMEGAVYERGVSYSIKLTAAGSDGKISAKNITDANILVVTGSNPDDPRAVKVLDFELSGSTADSATQPGGMTMLTSGKAQNGEQWGIDYTNIKSPADETAVFKAVTDAVAATASGQPPMSFDNPVG